MEWDIFICYASEDINFARQLLEALKNKNYNVWFDDDVLMVGDNYRHSIEHGLKNSKFGIVIVSPNFIKKEWPRIEFNAMIARARRNEIKILPVWHNITEEEINQHIPALAEFIGIKSEKNIGTIVHELERSINGIISHNSDSLNSSLNLGSVIGINISFYSNFILTIAITAIFASLYPFLVRNKTDFVFAAILNKRNLLSLYIITTLLITTRKVKSSWTKFLDEKKANYRFNVIATLIFTFFLVILNSGMFVSTNTNIPLYKFFININDQAEVVRWTFLINCLIATFSVTIFLVTNWLFMKHYGNNLLNMPLWDSTFLFSLIPIIFGFLPVLIYGEKGFANYVFVSIFPLILSLLAIQGYSHPANILTEDASKILFKTAIISCFFGFVISTVALMWYLTNVPEPPTEFMTFFSLKGYFIDWLHFPYPIDEYVWRWKQGFIWMVLTDVFFMELFPGLTTVLTIYHYQMAAGKGKVY